jgi:hypothetical protein
MERCRAVLVLALLLMPAVTVQGQQQPCGMPTVAAASREPNILTPSQAEMLGDLVMQQMAGELRLVNDPTLNRYAQAIADRMAEVSDAGKVRVELFDIPAVNAVAFPGGRVLLARKLVAFARSEDEVAGVLAHEIAHVLMRGPERRFSRAARVALQVTSIGDARDLEEKYNRFIEIASRTDARGSEQNSESNELIADELAVWLMTRVGYSAKAFVDFWDRVNELQSQTGNWLSDLFGTTKPGSKRLRAALKGASAMPASCAGTRPTTDAEFAQWQQSIVAASRATPTAALHGAISERSLDPPLRSDLSHVKFSPDGRWVLAQDDASVYVFSRAPLAFRWRADASDALPAQFSPDSAAIVFYDDTYRVERWSVSSGQREWVRDLAVTKGCVDAGLSADGRYFACVTPDLDLRVQQVAGGDIVFEKRGFYTFGLRDLLELVLAQSTPSDRKTHLFQMQYSPDVRFLVVARHDTSVAVDLAGRVAVPLPSSIRARVGLSFAFMGPDRIAGIHDSKPEDSAVLTFPGGSIVMKLKLGPCSLSAPTRGDAYLILRGVRGVAVGLFGTRENKPVGSNGAVGYDLYDDLYVTERRTGEIGLFRMGTATPLEVSTVPAGPLGRLRAADVSPDGSVLALSQRTRGAIWDLRTGQRTAYMRGFRGAHIDSDNASYLDFPREEPSQRTIVRFAAGSRTPEPLVGIDDIGRDGPETRKPEPATGSLRVQATITVESMIQHGPYLIGWRADERKKGDSVLEALDAATGTTRWSRTFSKGRPPFLTAERGHRTVAIGWPYGSDGARVLVEANPGLKARFEAMHSRKDDVGLLELVDLASGQTRGHLLTDFGNDSFRLGSVVLEAGTLVVNDNRNRTLAYSLATGKRTGSAFGTPLDVAQNGSIVVVQNHPGHLAFYSLPLVKRIDELTFPSRVTLARFQADDKQLFVLTDDQKAYVFTVGPFSDGAGLGPAAPRPELGR